MPQHYTYISFVLPITERWDVTEVGGIFNAYEEKDPTLAPAWFAYVHPGMAENLSLQDYIKNRSGLGISWEMHPTGLCVQSDEWADVDEIATIIQLAMKHYACLGHVSFQAGYDSDEPSDGVYGGAAVVITADGVFHMSTSELITQHVSTLGPLHRRLMHEYPA